MTPKETSHKCCDMYIWMWLRREASQVEIVQDEEGSAYRERQVTQKVDCEKTQHEFSLVIFFSTGLPCSLQNLLFQRAM